MGEALKPPPCNAHGFQYVTNSAKTNRRSRYLTSKIQKLLKTDFQVEISFSPNSIRKTSNFVLEWLFLTKFTTNTFNAAGLNRAGHILYYTEVWRKDDVAVSMLGVWHWRCRFESCCCRYSFSSKFNFSHKSWIQKECFKGAIQLVRLHWEGVSKMPTKDECAPALRTCSHYFNIIIYNLLERKCEMFQSISSN